MAKASTMETLGTLAYGAPPERSLLLACFVHLLAAAVAGVKDRATGQVSAAVVAGTRGRVRQRQGAHEWD